MFKGWFVLLCIALIIVISIIQLDQWIVKKNKDIVEPLNWLLLAIFVSMCLSIALFWYRTTPTKMGTLLGF